MNITTIQMSRQEARDKLHAYRTRTHKDVEAEYQTAEAIYQRLAQGARVLDLAPAIREAPRDAKGRPMLAIARADRPEVKLSLSRHNNFATYYCGSNLMDGFHRWPGMLVQVPLGGSIVNAWTEGYARVPMIPADVRPRRGQRRHWHILWDVEQWADRSTLEPPRDPWLLKHLVGTLYEVLAEWNLTEVERAVMRHVIS